MMWKDIPDWEEYYEINNYGEVRNKKSSRILVGDKNKAQRERSTQNRY